MLQLDKKTLSWIRFTLKLCMKQRILNKYAFTLVELIFVAMIIWLIMPAIFSLYNFIIRSNREISARQDTIQQWYEFFERLNILMQDYTIDYEEYFNRQMVGCTAWGTKGPSFTRSIWQSWYCTEFTAYGNQNSTNRWEWNRTKDHDLYYCSSVCSDNTDKWLPKVFKANKCGTIDGKQSYWQYATFFTDVWRDTTGDRDGNIVWDGDDYNVWYALNGVNAIEDPNHIQEIYLISHDGKRRLYFRRNLYAQSCTSDKCYYQYKIEMLRLRWFDAGIKHNFEVWSGNVWLYDWKIDTWACDTWMWFEWKWDSIWWAYPEYHLPKDVDDCRIPLTYWSTSVSARNIGISPTTDSDLSWNDETRQINAYMKIFTVNWVYLPYYTTGSISSSIGDFSVPLETAINMKDFYRE